MGLPTKKEADLAFDIFIEEFESKYPRAVDCVRNHRERLMAFYNYPAEHWQHVRTTNPIESTFSAVRLRTNKTKGCGNINATLTMVFKLIQSAQQRWQKLHSHEKVARVWAGIKFEDGIMVEEILLISFINFFPVPKIVPGPFSVPILGVPLQ